MERLPGSSQEEKTQSNSKRKLCCEEEAEGQPGKKRRKLATHRTGQLRKARQGEKNKEPRCVTDPAVHLSNRNAALSIGNVSEMHRDGPGEEARTCPWQTV